MEENLIASLKRNNIKYDKKKLDEVLNFAKEIYKDNIRYTNQTYLEHVLSVAYEVTLIKLDENSVYASILHEVLRFNVSSNDIKHKFGKEIEELISGVSRLSYLNYGNNEKLDIQTLRKMFMAIAKDIRVLLIKLVDRLCNMRIADQMEEDLRKRKAKETLEIYSPIAHRLGISNIKSELEDISFRVLMNKDYKYIKTKIDAKKREREIYIENRIKEIVKNLKSIGVKATVYGRPKHFYSIYKKMKQKNCDIDDIFDLLAIRIVVDSVKDCYTSLGIIHELYKPMPGRFKDYIAVPKTNNYQSLHTTVFGEKGFSFEVQIRTWDMHRHAEYGVAAHFMYKEKSNVITKTEEKIMWIRRTLELQKDLAEGNNFNSFKGELFGEEVFVFTPKGDIKSLPKGSTVIDFAYSIHQKIAESITGAKINGVVAPIYTKLKNTDVIQIITAKNAKGPTMDWLKHVKSNSSKNKITSFLKKQGFEENVARGKLLFEKEIRKQKILKEELLKEEYLKEMVQLLNSKNLEHVYENIGFGNISNTKAVNRLVNVYYKYNVKESKVIQSNNKIKSRNISKDYILVENLSNCLVKLAKCCSPIPGDDIIGYITNSNGVTVHRKGCKNIPKNDRTVNVKWKNESKSTFDTNIKIMANNREGITIDIINKLKDLKVNIIGMKADVTLDKILNIILTLNIENTEYLNKIIRELKKIDSVFEVKRNR